MTLEKPALMQRQMSSNSAPWSRLRATGTFRGSARASTMGTKASGMAFIRICRGETSMIRADFSVSAAASAARTMLRSGQLGAGMA